MVEGDDLHQALAKRAVEIDVGLGAGDADVFAGQVDGFVVLDLQVVVVDTVDCEAQLRGRGGCLALHARQFLFFAFCFFHLLLDHALQPFGRGLDRALVDIGGDPAPAQFLGDGGSRTGANEAI